MPISPLSELIAGSTGYSAIFSARPVALSLVMHLLFPPFPPPINEKKIPFPNLPPMKENTIIT